MNAPENVDTKDIFTSFEAAKFLEIHVDTCTKLARAGKLPCGIIGGQYRFSRQALLDYVMQANQSGGIREPRRLVDWPPERLIERVTNRGGELFLKDGVLHLRHLSRLPKALNHAVEQNIDAISTLIRKEEERRARYQQFGLDPDVTL